MRCKKQGRRDDANCYVEKDKEKRKDCLVIIWFNDNSLRKSFSWG